MSGDGPGLDIFEQQSDLRDHVVWFPFAQFPALDSVPISIFRKWRSCFRGLFSNKCF